MQAMRQQMLTRGNAAPPILCFRRQGARHFRYCGGVDTRQVQNMLSLVIFDLTTSIGVLTRLQNDVIIASGSEVPFNGEKSFL